ncbi:MAG: nucleoside-diphosphate-sugar epimerase, partial [Gammaproteobacteria bacterium]
MHALVTGGGGFLGAAIVKALLANGTSVRTFSRSAHSTLDGLDVDAHFGDLVDRAALVRAAQGCDVVYHVAAKAGVWGYARDYELANVVGTENVIAACAEHNVSQLIYTSSPSVVFAGTDESGVDERHPYPTHYLAHYPRTKAIAERHVIAAANTGLATIALRPHLIWGPGDPHLVPRILQCAQAGRLRLVGSGQNLVDSTYVDNAAQAHLDASNALTRDSSLSGRAYFISNDEPVPIRSLIDAMLRAGGLGPVERQIHPKLAYALGGLLEALYRLTGRQDEPIMTRFVARQLTTEHWYNL